jgi:drug/metabolite transporter (DMT)-like permease
MHSIFTNTSISSKPSAVIGASPRATAVTPLLCLLAAVVLLSSITPAIKYVFQHSDLHPIAMAGLRVMIGFFFLLLSTMLWDRRGVRDVAGPNTMPLTLLGLLGVGSYAVAAWGLLYTSVTHYILIYSLLPSFTALLSCALGREQASSVKVVGILVSLAGCVLVIWQDGHDFGTGSHLGDGLVMLFTLLMAAHIVLSSGIAARVNPLPANTLMFGGSSLMLSLVIVLFGTMWWGSPASEPLSPVVIAFVIYVGAATAAVFLFRYMSLRSLSPMTVGVYHNLVPVLTIIVACLCFGEMLEESTLVGGVGVLAGAEIVRRGNRSAGDSVVIGRSPETCSHCQPAIERAEVPLACDALQEGL